MCICFLHICKWCIIIFIMPQSLNHAMDAKFIISLIIRCPLVNLSQPLLSGLPINVPGTCNVFFGFDLILYVPSTIFQLKKDGSSWVEPVLSYDKYVLLKDHNAVTSLRLKSATPQSRVKHSTTEPLCSLHMQCTMAVQMTDM